MADGGDGHTVAEGRLAGGQAGACAVGLDARAPLVEGDVHSGGGLAVDFGLQEVGVEWDGADKGVRGLLSEREGAGGGDLEGAAGGEAVKLGDVKGYLEGLAGGDMLEGVVLEVLSG